MILAWASPFNSFRYIIGLTENPPKNIWSNLVIFLSIQTMLEAVYILS